jgi:hypothetical protein
MHDALCTCSFVKQKLHLSLPGAVLGNIYVARLSTENNLAFAVVGENYAVLPMTECEKLLSVATNTKASSITRPGETRGLVEITAIYTLTQPHQFAVSVAYTRETPGTYQTCRGDWQLKFSRNHLIFQSAINAERTRCACDMRNVWMSSGGRITSQARCGRQ